jgi:hypothetical protein
MGVKDLNTQIKIKWWPIVVLSEIHAVNWNIYTFV